MSIKARAIARASVAIGATAAVLIGVTFAQLTSQATLTDNTISSATADLKIWDGANFSSTAPGFHVTNLVPGTGTDFLPFYFKNSGGVGLDITAHVPSLPSSSGFSGWNNLKVIFKNDKTGVEYPTDMAALNSGNIPIGSLPAGAQGNAGAPFTEGNYSVKFNIEPSSITGGQVTVESFNIVFTGTQTSPPPPST